MDSSIRNVERQASRPTERTSVMILLALNLFSLVSSAAGGRGLAPPFPFQLIFSFLQV